MVVAATASGCGPSATPGPDECSRELSLVYVDDNGNGVHDDGEPGLGGAILFFDGEPLTIADRCGRFSIKPRSRDGLIWVRGQDGLDPGPFWARLAAETAPRLDIAVRRASGVGEFSFAVASDTHAGLGEVSTKDQFLALAQAASGGVTRPYFVTVTGDLTQENQPEQFETVVAAAAAIEIPYVPVPGNHDWYDGGAAYRWFFGPPSYSFDAGGVHFVVLNDAVPVEERLAFLDVDRALVDDQRPVVVLTHAPPREPMRLALEERNIDLLLTGHLHANRVLLHDTFTEYNTQPLVMGGMDLSPAGFRLISRRADGRFEVSHRTIVNRPIVRLMSPGVGQVFAPCTAQIIVAFEPGATIVPLTAWVESVGEVPLSPTGGWTYTSAVLESLCRAGSYDVSVNYAGEDGILQRASAPLVIGSLPRLPETADWPMLQGDAAHRGGASTRIGYPLRTQWVATVGGNIHGGAPVVADGRVFVAVADFGGGEAGGVVALDLRTGRTLWEHRVGFSVRNAAAVSDGVVVFVSNDGTVHGVDASSGEGRWTYELAQKSPTVERTLYASPTVADGIAYVGGRQEFLAIEMATGELIWRVEPYDDEGELASHASPAVSGHTVLAPFNRFDGMLALDASTGVEAWRSTPELVQAMQGSPVIDGPFAYVVNELTRLTAVDLREGRKAWSMPLESGAFEWGVLAASTPVVQGATILVGTQRGRLHAIDKINVFEKWSFDVETSLIRATHYHGEVPAITAAPVVAADVVWLPGQDGWLRALDLATGRQLWATELGVPMSSSPAIAGEVLIVASYDGSVRALRAWRPDSNLPR